MTHASRIVTLLNRRGLHARASAKFVTLAGGLPTPVEVEKDGSRVSGTSIMGLMMLGAACGDTIVIHASGDSAEASIDSLAKLVEDRFGED